MMRFSSESEGHGTGSYTSMLLLDYRLDELNRLATWIETVASHLSLTDRGKFRLEMVLTEAVTNVIQHGAEVGGDQEISVVLEQVGGDIRAEVRDGSRAFNPLKKPEVIFPRT